MVGNVWEWTTSVYGKDPHTRQPQYALRGGSYIDSKSGKFNHKADVTTRFVTRKNLSNVESKISAVVKRDLMRGVGIFGEL